MGHAKAGTSGRLMNKRTAAKQVDALCGAVLYGDYKLYMSLIKISPTLRLTTQRQLKRVLEWLENEDGQLNTSRLLAEINDREDEEQAKEFL